MSQLVPLWYDCPSKCSVAGGAARRLGVWPQREVEFRAGAYQMCLLPELRQLLVPGLPGQSLATKEVAFILLAHPGRDDDNRYVMVWSVSALQRRPPGSAHLQRHVDVIKNKLGDFFFYYYLPSVCSKWCHISSACGTYTPLSDTACCSCMVVNFNRL